MKTDIEVLERLMEPENDVIFSSCFIQQRKRTISWQTEDDGWRVREGKQHNKKVEKMSGMILSIKE